MTGLSAELAYLFRHALLRDAAYEMQLPSERAKLHELAFYLMEETFGGRAPAPAPLDAAAPVEAAAHPTDSVALELVNHAGLALQGSGGAAELANLRRLYLQRGAEHAGRAYQSDASASAWELLAELTDGASRGEALRRAASVRALSGRTAAAETLFERAVETQRQAGDRRMEGIALGGLANLASETGRPDRAEELYQQALQLMRDAGDRYSEGISLGNLALLYQFTGRAELAEHTYERTLEIHRAVGNRRYEGIALGNLALLHRDQGRLDQAERGYEAALAIHREVGNRRSEGIILGNLAALYQDSQRPEQARDTYAAALAIHRELGNRRSEAIARGNFAGLQRFAGRLDASRRGYEEALAMHREVGNRRFEGIHLCEYGLTLIALKHPRARDTWLEGWGILAQLGDRTNLDAQIAAMAFDCAEAGMAPFVEAPTQG